MSVPDTSAGRRLSLRHPELAEAVLEVEHQAGGLRAQADRERLQRVLDRLRRVFTPDQAAAVVAVLTLDPDAIEVLDDDRLRFILSGLSSMTPDQDPDAREAAREAAARYLREIM